MGKKKGPIWNFFSVKMDKSIQCKYCNAEYKHANSNKMERHIKKCFKCPAGLKTILNKGTRVNSFSVKETENTATTSNLGFQEHLRTDVDDTDEPCEASQMSSSPQNSPKISATKSSCSPSLPKATGTSANLLSEMSSSSSSARISKTRIDDTPTFLTAFVDRMDETSNEILNQHLAKAIFVSGSPFSLVEHPLWIDFLKKIRPSYCLPSRFRLASTYLDAQYTEMQCEVKRQLSESKHIHLQCDGWSNLRNESVINFVISKPQPLFVDFVMSKENKHEASYLAQQIEKVMNDHGLEKFFVLIGDNAANMRAAFRSIKAKYQNIVPLGCLSHLLHLLCNDILNCNSIQTFLSHAIEIVKSIKRSHQVLAIFRRIQNQEVKKSDAVSLKLPAKTRWGSYLHCFQSLVVNKFVLQTLAVSEAQLSPELKKRLLDDEEFWVFVEKIVLILKPIVNLIVAFESNEPQIHLVNRQFSNLENTLLEQLPMFPLDKADQKLILDKFKKRKDFGIGPIHLAAEILNPLLQGGDLEPSDLLDGLTFIYEVGKQMKLNSIQLKTELVHYREKDGLWGRKILWEGLESMSPLLWWRSLRGTSIIVEVALRILSAPVASAATERTFSAFSWIHSKKRNRLTSERAAKLTYISHNWKLLHSNEETKRKKKKLDLMSKDNISQEKQDQEKEQSCASEESTIKTKKLCDFAEVLISSESGSEISDSD